MKKILLLITLLFSFISFSQVYNSKEYSKERALYKSKAFVIKNIVGADTIPIKFEIDPLAAATSGELTTLIYNCSRKNLNGIIFGFFGNFWNEEGVIYKGYAFKNLPKEKALELLSILQKRIEENYEYMFNAGAGETNIVFKWEDMTFLMSTNKVGFVFRIFWKEFDADWNYSAFKRTKKRFEKKS